MRAWVLGAGASKSYGASPTGQRMPIARDFFRTFQALDLYANPWVLWTKLAGYLERTGRDPESFLAGDVDIEELHSEIEAEYLPAVEDGEQLLKVLTYGPYAELMFLFAAVVNAIQNGPLSAAHEKLAARMGPEDRVVTFNWDTLMDRALATRTGWRPDWGYGIRPQSVFRDGWDTPSPAPTDPGPTVLKLHGSANWITSHTAFLREGLALTQSSSPGTVYVFEHATRPYAAYAGRYMDGYEPFSYGYYPPNILDDAGRSADPGYVLIQARPKFPWIPESTTSDEGLVTMPLIIPPVKEKRYGMFGELFTTLWAQAEDALATADEIVLIGYSFPHTDHRSNRLFLDAFSRRATIPRVTLVDPAPDRIRDKFLYEFGIPETHLRVHPVYFTETSFDDGSVVLQT
ncbi:MAG TPA: hypothetical protein VFQ76_14430 [Longimicrobiaceae bacterium]|nr:hypothetical protein [Longimicrobiaceae bacterium]